ncbi:hypothetical protein [Zhihengliuella sp. ISTPL4]|uniref:hypothetical protein n=1 Tax=Zhihengliuella sp. ISTPL4 TaxID=2058657 RepID=UPI0018F25B75|nr:hypothetical protein [Zhihengliuella sp. ISTPL4]
MSAVATRQKRNSQNVISAPRGADNSWQEKAAVARRARDAASVARAGKPSSFRGQVGRIAS